MTRIALLGTGHMGRPIARRLMVSGHDVTVWNRTPARAVSLVADGAKLAATPADAVPAADVVIVMVTDAGAVEELLFGAWPGVEGTRNSAISAIRMGACVLLMSTIGADEVRLLARRMPNGVALIDCPVGGSVLAAESGQLKIFAGGDDAVIDSVEPVLETLGTVRRCGALGSGAAVKLVINTAMIIGVTALRDTLLVAEAVGVDRALVLEMIGSGPLGGAVARATATNASFAVALAAKDLRIALRDVHGAMVAAAAVQTLLAVPHQNADLAILVPQEQNETDPRQSADRIRAVR